MDPFETIGIFVRYGKKYGKKYFAEHLNLIAIEEQSSS